jgi:hypothetical protein
MNGIHEVTGSTPVWSITLSLRSSVLDHPLGGKRRRAFSATSGSDSRLVIFSPATTARIGIVDERFRSTISTPHTTSSTATQSISESRATFRRRSIPVAEGALAAAAIHWSPSG